jgi:hypothetical protein
MSKYKEIKKIDLSGPCGNIHTDKDKKPEECQNHEMCQEILDNGGCILYNKKKNGCLLLSSKEDAEEVLQSEEEE